MIHRRSPRGFAILALAVACDPATDTTAPTEVVHEPPATAADPAACPVGPASPLMLQRDVQQSSTLASAMARDVAVVAFDCKDLVVLDSCNLAGHYEFVARPRTEIDRRFSSRKDVEAARPLWGTSTPALEIESGETLALKLITIGQRRANLSRVARKDLDGDCARATHFVRAVHVGAYELTGTRGTQKREQSAGDLQACTATASQPPSPQCIAPLQLELSPIVP